MPSTATPRTFTAFAKWPGTYFWDPATPIRGRTPMATLSSRVDWIQQFLSVNILYISGRQRPFRLVAPIAHSLLGVCRIPQPAGRCTLC